MWYCTLSYFIDKAQREIIPEYNALNENYISKEVVGFTFLQATLSTILTVFIGLPIAWQLGRYEWPFQSFIKSILTMPFVMPSIVAAIGFLNLMEIYDLRSNENSGIKKRLRRYRYIYDLWVCIVLHTT